MADRVYRLDRYLDAVDEGGSPVQVRGLVRAVTGPVIRASIPDTWVGELCLIESPHASQPVRAEVVGFEAGEVLLMALGDVVAVGPQSEVIPTGSPLTVPVGPALLGRVVNGLGEPVDGKGAVAADDHYPVSAPPPEPLQREPIARPLSIGIKVIDGLLTCGEGQRVGVFAAAGVGKSTLMGMIARDSDADVNVIALVGERGREVRDFVEKDLGPEGMQRSVLVVATSNEPSLVRLKAAYVATAIAEYFRDQGRKVTLLMDSVTRFARAQREVGLACGEPPARAGYTPSVFAELPKLLERSGNSDKGSITAFYTVLVAGDDMNEPVADEVRSLLDGHIVLSRSLAAQSHYPAVDVLRSVSRVMNAVVDDEHRGAADRIRQLLACYEEHRDLIQIGAYESGSDAGVDEAIDRIDQVNDFLRQHVDERRQLVETQEAMQSLVQDEP